MGKETRTAIYDRDTGIEAFRFSGFMRPFPPHFHRYYVIGLIQNGKRKLICHGNGYTAEEGDMLIFNPGDVHGCSSLGSSALEYISVNIKAETMKRISGIGSPRFSRTVVKNGTLQQGMLSLITAIEEERDALEKEEALTIVVSELLDGYSGLENPKRNEYSRKIDDACGYIEKNYGKRLTLALLSDISALSVSTFLRAFAKEKGVTPHVYIENVRIRKASALLASGIRPGEAALMTGFSDQSHFTNVFSRYIGLTPGTYFRMFKER